MVKKYLIVLLAAALALTACGGAAFSAATPTPSEPWTTHTEEPLGIRIAYPEAWAVKSEDGGLYLSDDEANFGSPVVPNGAGVVIATFPTSDFKGITDPVELLNAYHENFQALGGVLEPDGETETLTIHDNPAAFARYTGNMFDQPGAFTLTAIIHGDTAAAIFTMDTTTGGIHSDRLRRIAESVEFLK